MSAILSRPQCVNTHWTNFPMDAAQSSIKENQLKHVFN